MTNTDFSGNGDVALVALLSNFQCINCTITSISLNEVAPSKLLLSIYRICYYSLTPYVITRDSIPSSKLWPSWHTLDQSLHDPLE